MRIITAILFCTCALPLVAQDCRQVLGKQSPDANSLKRVEERWNEAFMHGGTQYLECLLAPEYASVSPTGVHDRAWELEHAGKNKGSSAPIPEVPGMRFEIYGNTGVMRLYKPASADGKLSAQYMADIFAFQDGAWRAVYSQHTPVQTTNSSAELQHGSSAYLQVHARRILARNALPMQPHTSGDVHIPATAELELGATFGIYMAT